MMAELAKILSRLRTHYGDPALPPARGPFEHVMWENACYLLPDERRAQVFEGLRVRVGLNAKAIAEANRETLFALASQGGMRPEVRVLRWLEIAHLTLDQFEGDLDRILSQPYAEAKRALKQFPGIGDPGAEKILMLCGSAAGLPLESNGLRVLTRIGYGRENLKNYGAMYRSVQEAIAPEAPKDAAAISQAHLLLRQHGKETCRTNDPECFDCPVAEMCADRRYRD